MRSRSPSAAGLLVAVVVIAAIGLGCRSDDGSDADGGSGAIGESTRLLVVEPDRSELQVQVPEGDQPAAVSGTPPAPGSSSQYEPGADVGPNGSAQTTTSPATTVVEDGEAGPPPRAVETDPADGVLLAVLIIAAGGDLDLAVSEGLVTEDDIEAALRAIAEGNLDRYVPEP